MSEWKLGIHYGIEPEDYDCDDDRFTFGDPNVYEHHGNTINNQSILLDGKQVGRLWEFAPYNILEPMKQSFMFFLENDEIDHPNFFDDEEYNWLWFAKLQDFVDFIKSNPDLVKKYYDVDITPYINQKQTEQWQTLTLFTALDQ